MPSQTLPTPAGLMPVTPESHPARYFALLYSAAPQRRLLDALFGIENEVSESLRPGLDHNVAHSRLQWWREECDRTAEGHPVHPLTRELAAAFNSSGGPLPQLAGLSGFVDAAVWDLAGATFETRRELAAYCERWAAAMIGPIGGTHSRTLGAALRELEMLANLAREAHSGRLRIPLDDLERVGADPATLANPPWSEPVATLLRDRHEALRGDVARSLGNLAGQPQEALRGLLVWVALAWRSSLRAQRALPDALRRRRFDAIADAWFAWRAARRATAGQLRLE
jgi:phytoene synthase